MRRHNFKELRIWQLGIEIVDDIYNISEKFPKEEQFGLTLQMRKASVSIPSNIAEGCGRGSNPQLTYFLDVSIGSAYELETQCYISLRRKYCTPEIMDPVISKIIEEQKMSVGFRNKHS